MTIQLPIIGTLDRALEEIALDGCDPDQATIAGTRRQGTVFGKRRTDGRLIQITYRTKGVPLQRAKPNAAFVRLADVTHDGQDIQVQLSDGNTFTLARDDAEVLYAAVGDALDETPADQGAEA